MDRRWEERCRRGGRKCEGGVGEEVDKRLEEKWTIKVGGETD